MSSGSVSLQERNFLGKGYDVKIDTTVSFKRQNVDFSFTNPYFMGLPISAGFDLFATQTDNTDISSYDSRQIGGALRTGFRLDEYSVRSDCHYGIAWRDIDGIDAAMASPAVIAHRRQLIQVLCREQLYLGQSRQPGPPDQWLPRPAGRRHRRPWWRRLLRRPRSPWLVLHSALSRKPSS